MKVNQLVSKLVFGLFVSAASFAVCAQSMKVTLSGAQEVPPVMTSASGMGSIMVSSDGAISGNVTTTGVEVTMAHIHLAPMGQNGPVIVPFAKTADNVWSVPAGAKLTDAQLQSLKSGDLYINVHSAANKGGEIRAQLKP
ncbi:CHRD domain-containing protein [Polynucleobacter antarcticus]|uniref:CHRD domain-containing protein n=1 Tax=Polynucleobacter antarcticus TaxID=1743162 RepID=A0A6M9PR95_9BURK|nr:CHRD domain-containing protein [Polynucleobacter antarcticus]QKM62402.1 CHRD domain-containing protein [Polynucleobacter antarcticus]